MASLAAPVGSPLWGCSRPAAPSAPVSTGSDPSAPLSPTLSPELPLAKGLCARSAASLSYSAGGLPPGYASSGSSYDAFRASRASPEACVEVEAPAPALVAAPPSTAPAGPVACGRPAPVRGAPATPSSPLRPCCSPPAPVPSTPAPMVAIPAACCPSPSPAPAIFAHPPVLPAAPLSAPLPAPVASLPSPAPSSSLLRVRVRCAPDTGLGACRPSCLSPNCVAAIDECLERHRSVAPIYLFRDPNDAGLLTFATVAGYDGLLFSLATSLRALIAQASSFFADVHLETGPSPAALFEPEEGCGQNW